MVTTLPRLVTIGGIKDMFLVGEEEDFTYLLKSAITVYLEST